MTITEADRTAADVTWDIEPLVDGEAEAGVDALLDEADAKAREIAEVPRPHRRARRRRPRRAHARARRDRRPRRPRRLVRGPALRRRHRRPGERRADRARRGEVGTAINNEILFVELEWAAVDDDRAAALLADEQLAFCRHYLESARRYRPHLLSEPEERILSDKSLTASSAWVRLFSELTSAITVDLDGGAVSLEEGLSLLHVARPRRAAHRRRGGHRRAGAGPAHPWRSCSTRCSSTSRSTTACVTTTAGSRAGT